MSSLAFSEIKLSPWRKTIFVVGLALTFLLGFVYFVSEMNTYAAAPRSPEPATGHIYPVRTTYGYFIYLSSPEQEKLGFWEPLVGVPLIPALLALATSKEFWEHVRAQ